MDQKVVDPIPLIDGRYEPRMLVEGWSVDLSNGTITHETLDHAGQAWSRTRRDHLVATTHPESNLIRLSSESTACWLAWHRPRGVVWIGEHLLISGADGRVALVRDAWATVTSVLASTSTDLHATAPERQEA